MMNKEARSMSVGCVYYLFLGFIQPQKKNNIKNKFEQISQFT